MNKLVAALILGSVWGGAGFADDMQSTSGMMNVDIMASDLEEPWAIGFLPNGSALITERDGKLFHLRADGAMIPVQHELDIAAKGQGGLLDVMIPRDFMQSREVFLSFSTPQGRGEGTALAKARLNAAGDRLIDATVLFEMAAGSRGGRHFGSRVVEARDGALFLTIGERGDRPSAQDPSNHNGTIVRINRDGTVPADNPFVDEPDIRPEIWSFGHRNPQGAALDLNGQLWAVEHGAAGGDEVNEIQSGANFGWPVISYGQHYSGRKIGVGTAQDGLEQPAYYWDPSIAPSGMMIYSGKLWPEWRGDMFVGSLKFDYISRLDGAPLAEVERLANPDTERVRDIREAPDGSIWFLSVGQGAAYRITPK